MLQTARKGAEAKEGLSGPTAKVNGEGDAVAAEAGKDENSFVSRMVSKDRAKIFCEENGAAPAVSNANGFESGVQIADASFEPFEALRRGTFVNIETQEIAIADAEAAGRTSCEGPTASSRTRNEACAEDDAVVFEQASPEIREINGVERAARREAGGAELNRLQRGRSEGKSKLGLGKGVEAGELE